MASDRKQVVTAGLRRPTEPEPTG